MDIACAFFAMYSVLFAFSLPSFVSVHFFCVYVCVCVRFIFALHSQSALCFALRFAFAIKVVVFFSSLRFFFARCWEFFFLHVTDIKTTMYKTTYDERTHFVYFLTLVFIRLTFDVCAWKFFWYQSQFNDSFIFRVECKARLFCCKCMDIPSDSVDLLRMGAYIDIQSTQ